MTAIQRESWGGGALVEFNSCYGYPEQPSKSRPQPQGEQAGKGPGGAALAQQRELPPGAAASAPAPSSASPRLASPGGFAPLPGLGQASRARPGGEGEGTGRSLRAAPGQEVLPVVMGRSAPTTSLQREFCSLAAWA